MGRVTWVAAVWVGDEVGWDWCPVPWRGEDSTEKLPSMPGAPNKGLGRTETLIVLLSAKSPFAKGGGGRVERDGC